MSSSPTPGPRPLAAMKIALLGCGKMGRLIEELAPGAGMEVAARFDSRHPFAPEAAAGAEVAFDFSVAGAVLENIRRCASARLNLVVGTTGWHERLDEARAIVAEHGIGMVYGANFSVGVNLFYRVIQQAAGWMKEQPEYDPWIWEMHHRAKKDAPSGTALKLRALLREAYGERDFSVASIRAGQAPGTHTVGFDSEADSLVFTHETRNRKGLALGALRAARWIQGKKGCYEFSEVLWAPPH